eukprot:snap_masked-scaffold_42-processed-gene-1.32-mRNA-1 protein AED:1.00 eAED:1.00 QI:0/-1/0/0/-1/1/1/0/177
MPTTVEKLSMSLDEIAKLDRKNKAKNNRNKSFKARPRSPPNRRFNKGNGQRSTPTRALNQMKKKKPQNVKSSKKQTSKTTTQKSTESKKPAKELSTGTFIRLGPINSDVDEQDIREQMKGYGKIKLVKFVKNGRTKKREAEIKFSLRKNAEKVVKEFNGLKLDGREIHVKIIARSSG